VALEFDVATLLDKGWIEGAEKDEGIILGLPLWATYYTVFDIKGHTVTFVSTAEEASEPATTATTTTATTTMTGPPLLV